MCEDFFGNYVDVSNKKLWLFDMDGTIYKDSVLFDGVLEFLEKIIKNGGRYIFLTNNSSRSVVDYIRKLSKMGIFVEKDSFYTSAQATADYLICNYKKSKIYCQGTMSFVDELLSYGLNVTTDVVNVDIVVVGFDQELTSEKLRKTCEILQTQDVLYLATNEDLCCPCSFGFIPDCGSICSMIHNATKLSPVFMGKPNPRMIDFVRLKFGYDSTSTVVVGDRLYTDIACGINANVCSICVLSGEANEADIRNGHIKPTYTFKDIRALSQAFF